MNNIRANLRWVDGTRNNLNRSLMIHNKSGYRGVHYFRIRKGNVYRVQISYKRFRASGGEYKTPQEAAGAYNYLALKYHGADAQLNLDPNGNPLPPPTKLVERMEIL